MTEKIKSRAYEELQKIMKKETDLKMIEIMPKNVHLLPSINEKEDLIRTRISDATNVKNGLHNKNEKLLKEIKEKKKELKEKEQENIDLQTVINNLKLEIQQLENGSETQEYLKNVDHLRLELKLLQKLTGVYFDYNAPENTISGFIGIQSTVPRNNKVMPIMIEKSLPEKQIVDKIWEKIEEACIDEDLENVTSNFSNANIQ